MKLILNPAITLDGNIAMADGNSDWPTEEDGNLFHELVKKCGAVIVGKNTFEQYKGAVFPIDGAVTYVWTHNPDVSEIADGVEYISGEPSDVLKKIETNGPNDCVLAGGTITNNAFVKAGLVDEIMVTIYPLLFGNGMRLLTLDNFELKLELLETKQIGGGVVRNHYKVLK